MNFPKIFCNQSINESVSKILEWPNATAKTTMGVTVKKCHSLGMTAGTECVSVAAEKPTTNWPT